MKNKNKKNKIFIKKGKQHGNNRVDKIIIPGIKQPVATVTVEKLKDVKSMNIYQKTQAIRNALQEGGVTKSGKNDNEGFNYYELGDFLPQLNKLMDEYQVMTFFIMGKESATLDVINSEKPEEKLTFTLPVAEVNLSSDKKAEPIQKLGGQVTYMRRYLLQVAFEISVKEVVDSTNQITKEDPNQLSESDIDRIRGAEDADELFDICQDIRATKGFNKEKSLLYFYTLKKKEFKK